MNELPEKIGPYFIEGLFEEGGISSLFLARNSLSNELVIIKTLKKKIRSNPTAIDLIERESKLIDVPEHPNINKLLEYGKSEIGPYLVMEFVRGTTLHKTLKSNPVPLKRALDILLQLCYALSHLHSYNITHGDLKPENILINDLGQVKLIDIGIRPSQVTGSHVIGTALYMSPEHKEEIFVPTVQSDIYALGIIAFELVLGKITHGKVIVSLAPKGLQPILVKALQPDPLERYQSLSEMIEDLSKYIHSGELGKDRQGSDYFFELYDELETARKALIDNPWAETIKNHKEIGFSVSSGIGLYGLYAGLKERDSSVEVIFAQMKNHGSLGVIDAYSFGTLWKSPLSDPALSPITPKYSSITFQNNSWTISHNTWGYFFLFRDKDAIELPPKGTFKKNDKVIFIGASITPMITFPNAPILPSTVLILNLLRRLVSLDSQQITDALLQHLRLLGIATLETSPVCLFCYGK